MVATPVFPTTMFSCVAPPGTAVPTYKGVR
jgi:hypothetical protein